MKYSTLVEARKYLILSLYDLTGQKNSYEEWNRIAKIIDELSEEIKKYGEESFWG